MQEWKRLRTIILKTGRGSEWEISKMIVTTILYYKYGGIYTCQALRGKKVKRREGKEKGGWSKGERYEATEDLVIRLSIYQRLIITHYLVEKFHRITNGNAVEFVRNIFNINKKKLLNNKSIINIILALRKVNP